jgi:hypothetical protein
MVPANKISFLDWTEGEPFIFVSYARENCDFVYPEIERLKADGYTMWYDKEQIRASHFWSNEINAAIEACSCFLVFITARAVESQRVIGEIKQALSLKKPVIAIYWHKVVLPPGLHDHLQKIQGLEFYDLHRRAYESQLGRALTECVPPKPRSVEKNDSFAKAADLKSSEVTHGISPKLVCFILILLGLGFSFFAIVVAVVPFFGSAVPGDPLANPLAGFAAGFLFLLVAFGLYIAAFAVYRKYLRTK